jgi:DNA-binding NarL/FixJ family response regulator
MTVRVVLADDHPLTRQGVHAALEEAPDIQVVGEANDGVEARELVAELRPDVLLLDLVMPGPRPSEVARWVRNHCPQTTTLVLTGHDRDSFLAEMAAEAAGFITKNQEPARLVMAIRRAASGKVLYTQEQLKRARRWREEVEGRWKGLTKRERRVVSLIAAGKSNKQIAQALIISEHTVETHVGNTLRKLNVASRTEAAVWLWEHGLAKVETGAGGNPPEENG